ncbi:hypothetical protein FKN01_28205 [Streptomyces sp. 130]|uniref:hypothetical protein n=1 Tax=Streptomyces sp. 130 TaxID=2591006 RepID=UPI00117C15C6|nr:hypothetical protein [Streptomyces sp. 130]TRV73109.1 hypothetical protein FKN01_28205 [Streptomyces sp. 130]
MDMSELRRAMAQEDPDAAGELTDRALREMAGGWTSHPVLRHPLGFLYVQLDRRPDSVLRLHLWPEVSAWEILTTSPYHMHAWDLISYVHQGDMTNTVVGAAPCLDDPEYRVFDILGEGAVDVLTPTEELVRTHRESRETIRAGMFYRIDAGKYHASRTAASGWAVSTALVTRVPGGEERALGPLSLKAHRTRRQVCLPEELRTAAQEVVAETGPY